MNQGFAVYDDEMPAAVSVGLHGHVARMLADAGAPWDQVARHVLAAPQAIDGRVLSWLVYLPAPALYALPATAADLLRVASDEASHTRLLLLLRRLRGDRGRY